MRLVVLIAAGLVIAAPAIAQKSAPAIDAALVTKIEEQLVMPSHALPLGRYLRFYALAEVDGREAVRGVYLAWTGDRFLKQATPVEGVAGAYVMNKGSDLPWLFDGGCGVIETAFDLAAQKPVIHGLRGFPDVEAPNATAICHGTL